MDKIKLLEQELIHPSTQQAIGLYTGLSGITLLHHLRFQDDTKTIELIESLFEKAQAPATLMSFCSGLSGLGWMIELLAQQSDLIEDTNEILDDLDELVIDWMKSELQNNRYDFMHGAIGGGLYLLKRIESNKSQLLIREIEDFTKVLIAQKCRAAAGGYYWIQRAGVLRTEEDRINFGLSHGFPSILVFLCKVYQTGIMKEDLEDIIRGSVQYLLDQALDPLLYGNYFPTSLFPNSPEKNNYSSRLAWCYGDLGIGITLWHANQILRSDSLQSFIIKVLKLASRKRGLTENSIHDAGFCHGSAGAAYIFHKFHLRYGVPELKEAAEYWLQQTFKIGVHSEGPAGYLFYSPQSENQFIAEYGMLEGIAGIYSCIATINNDLVSTWDEMFLIS